MLHDIITNNWAGFLSIGLLSGVIGGLTVKRVMEYPQGSSQGNETQGCQCLANTPHRRTGNNDNKERNNNNNDPMGLAMGFVFIAVMIASVLLWMFARFGGALVPLALLLAVAISTGVITYFVRNMMNHSYSDMDIPVSLVLAFTLILNVITLFCLKQNMDPEFIQYAANQRDIVQFFIELSAYGKILILAQLACMVLVILSQLGVVYRATHIKNGNADWWVDTMFILPFWGLLPLWLSQPEWVVNSILYGLI